MELRSFAFTEPPWEPRVGDTFEGLIDGRWYSMRWRGWSSSRPPLAIAEVVGDKPPSMGVLAAMRPAQSRMARFYFADGSVVAESIPRDQFQRDRLARFMPFEPFTGRAIGAGLGEHHYFHRRTIAVPPDVQGPLESDDVEDLLDGPGRQAIVRELGEEAARRVFGPSRSGWRYVSVYVEDGAPWLERWKAA